MHLPIGVLRAAVCGVLRLSVNEMTMPNPNPQSLEERLRAIRARWGIDFSACEEAADALAARDKLLAEAREALEHYVDGWPVGGGNIARSTLANLKTAAPTYDVEMEREHGPDLIREL